MNVSGYNSPDNFSHISEDQECNNPRNLGDKGSQKKSDT